MVLLRQHFCGRHDCRLRAGFDRAQHRQQRDHRLAGTDIALQQTQHALRRGHVGLNLADRFELASGQREG